MESDGSKYLDIVAGCPRVADNPPAPSNKWKLDCFLGPTLRESNSLLCVRRGSQVGWGEAARDEGGDIFIFQSIS